MKVNPETHRVKHQRESYEINRRPTQMDTPVKYWGQSIGLRPGSFVNVWREATPIKVCCNDAVDKVLVWR
ncbi:hypothetical protein DRH13_02605 [Candidatus Woesebacteria bacterium]|nr:MAG: hypothetical protein DRH13_02605 [Candidatus Woesebacteria bacterium]